MHLQNPIYSVTRGKKNHCCTALLTDSWFFQVRPVQPCHAHSAPFRPGRPTTPRRLWKGTMSAVACPSIPPVVAEEAPAIARQRSVMAQAGTTTTVTAMATITLLEDRLRPWRWRGTILTLTPIATLVGGLFPDLTPASTRLFIHLTLVKNACLLAIVGRCIASPPTWQTSLRSRCLSIPMASTPCSTSAPPAGALNSAARAPRASVIWSTLCSASSPSPILWRHRPSGSTTAQEEAGTIVAREAGDTGVEERMEGAITQATSLGLPGGTSLENEARAETPGTSRADATVAGRQAGGALMTTWTVTAAFWWAEAEGGTPVDTRVWMQPSRSSLWRGPKKGWSPRVPESAWPAPRLLWLAMKEVGIMGTMATRWREAPGQPWQWVRPGRCILRPGGEEDTTKHWCQWTLRWRSGPSTICRCVCLST